MAYGPAINPQQGARAIGGGATNPQFGLGALVPIGASLLGGVLGGMGQKDQSIDWDEMTKMFGPGAVMGDANTMFQGMMQSPMLSQILGSGASQGNRLNQRMMRNMASSGLSGSPMGQFAKAAGTGYGGNIQRQMLSNAFMQALQAAMQNNQARMGMFQNQQNMRINQPNFLNMLGSSLFGAGAQGLMNIK